MQAGLRRHAIPTQCIVRAIVPDKRRHIRGHFGHFLRAPEPVEATDVCYRGTARGDKMQASIRHFPTPTQRSDFK